MGKTYRVVMFADVKNETQWEGVALDERLPYPWRESVVQADAAGYDVGARWPIGRWHYGERVS